jgi:hypothetical protein
VANHLGKKKKKEIYEKKREIYDKKRETLWDHDSFYIIS